MLQIIFNNVSAREMASMPRKLQLELIDGFQVLPQDFEKSGEKFGQLTRGGKQVYRCRVGDYRIYFDKQDNIINVRCIIHRNTLQDFLYRSKLPVSEDRILEENPKFWQLVEKSAKK